MAVKAASNASRSTATAITTTMGTSNSLMTQMAVIASNVLVFATVLLGLVKAVNLVFDVDYFEQAPTGFLPFGAMLVGVMALAAVYVSESTVTKDKTL
jgi:hypothetical protein